MKVLTNRHNVWAIFREQGPEAALEAAFSNERQAIYHMGRNQYRIFAWSSLMGNHGRYRYGSFRHIYRSELMGREYKIELSDGGCGIAIFWTDVVHDPKTYRAVPKQIAPPSASFARI